MSVSDFEEQVFNYVWRGFVLAGLFTLLWSVLAPATDSQTQAQSPAEANTASNQASRSPASANAAR